MAPGRLYTQCCLLNTHSTCKLGDNRDNRAMKSRERNLKLAGRYRRLGDFRHCAYCGELATCQDHVLPVVVAARFGGLAEWEHLKLLIPACFECNGIAGGKFFRTLTAKRRYIQNKLRKKYRKLLAMPDWSEEDLASCGPNLRASIETALTERRVILARLAWR